MKNFLTILFSILILLAASSCAPSTPGESNNSNLPDPSLYRPQDRYDFFIETADCYYYLYNKMIYVSVKDNPAFYFLCSKPDCPHGGKDCNAYGGCAVGYWNGHLYSALLEGETPSFVQMDLDGSNHKEVAEIVLPLDANGSEGGSYQFNFHNGYIFYHVQNTSDFYFGLSLETGKTERLFESLSDKGRIDFSNFTAQNENIYFLTLDGNAPEEQILQSYDTNVNTIRELMDWSEDNFGMRIDGDIVYYFDSRTKEFCEHDCSTGTTLQRLHFDCYGGAPYYGDDYIYFVTWGDDADETGLAENSFTILSRDYQLCTEVSLPPNSDFLYAAGDVLFFSNLPSRKITHYLPKSAIGAGEVELLPIEDPYSYR